MTPNDSEMDVVLRRFAKVASGVKTTDHLDADELSAFAEDGLPTAARSRYVSHLADCDDCRRAVTSLAAASGRVEPMTAPVSQPAATESWWQKVGRFFAPVRLRYAAFAALLVAVVGIGFAVWRNSQKRPVDLVAQNEPTASREARTASQPQEPAANNAVAEQSPAAAAKEVTKAQAPFLDQKQPEATGVNPPPPPKPADTLAQNQTVPSSAGTLRTVEPSSNAAPSYAPPPPVETERADTRSREQNQNQNQNQNLGILQGPQRGESTANYKTQDDRLRGTGDNAKARDEDRARTGSDQPAAKEEKKDEAGARKESESRAVGLVSRRSEVRQEAPKSDKAGPPEEADTRSVGGRKFKRQGNEWVDVKLKSSMSIMTISRSSEGFGKLDSGLRSISQQFSGPVVIVWKGKAYRIQ